MEKITVTINKQRIFIVDDILHASEVLDDVFEKYDTFAKYTKEKKKKSEAKALSTEQPQASNSESLLDFAGNLGRGDTVLKTTAIKNTAIDELGDIFSTGSDSKNIVEPLKPVNLMPSGENCLNMMFCIRCR